MKNIKIVSLVLIFFSIFYLIITYIDISNSQRAVEIRKLDTSEQSIFNYGTNKIKMKCSIVCDFANIPCMLRHRQEPYKNVVFKGDDLACDLDYTNVKDENITLELWFYKDYTTLQNNVLKLSNNNQQILYRPINEGSYGFIIAYLPSSKIGWEFSMPKFEIYVYESIRDYESKLIAIRQADWSFILSICGIILGVIGILYPVSLAKIEFKKYIIHIYEKLKKKKNPET